MSNVNILNLPVAISLDGNEYAPVVQGGTTKRARTSLFDISGTGGGPQEANTVYAGPASGASTNPSFRALVDADMPLGTAGYALIGNGSSQPAYQAFTQTGTGGVARTWQGKGQDTRSVFDFIPVALQAAITARTSSSDVSSYIQAAVDACAYQTLEWPGGKYVLRSVITISSPIYMVGAGRDAQYIGAGSTYVAMMDDAATGFSIQSANVIIEKMDLSGTANRAAGSARAIIIGGYDSINVDVTGNNTVTNLTGSFASGDDRKRIRITGAGTEGASNYYFGILSGYSSGAPTVMTVSPTTTSNPSGAAAIYGKRITGVILRDLAISSHAVGIDIVTADQYLIDDCFLSNTDSIHVANVLGVDAGDSTITNCFIAAESISGVGVAHSGGGALRIINNKFSTASTHLDINWVNGVSGGPLVVGNSFENQTNYSIRSRGDSSDAMMHGLTIVGNWFNGGANANVFIEDTISVRNLHVASNTFVCGSSNRGMVIGALVDGFNLSSNMIDGNNVASCVGIEIKAGAANGLVGANTYDNLTTPVTNAGTNVTFTALDPTTTAGDMIYRNASALTRVAIGAANRIMTSTGSAPSWSATISGVTASSAWNPTTNDGAALGGVGAAWSDATFASGCVITLGDVVMTNTSANKLTISGISNEVVFDAGSAANVARFKSSGSTAYLLFGYSGTSIQMGANAGDFEIQAASAKGLIVKQGGGSFTYVQAAAGLFTTTSANALTVGANGTTNPVLNVNAATASVATGLNITGAAAGSGAAVAVISSGSNENLTVDAKGSGVIRLGATSTGAIEHSRNAVPTASDGAALGTTALMWSDLFLASGGVINFNSGDVTITHSANALAFAGASSGYTFDALVDVTGTVQADVLRIDQAASSIGTGAKTISNAADSSTNFGKYFSINLNGTVVYIPCSTVAPT